MNPDLVERWNGSSFVSFIMLKLGSSGTARRLRELVQLGYGARYAAWIELIRWMTRDCPAAFSSKRTTCLTGKSRAAGKSEEREIK